MRFCEIPGHDEIKSQLRTIADSGKIPHAILFEGPEGVGKYMLARAFLQYISCHNKKDGDSCGVCPSCRQHSTMQHIDTIFSFPVIKKKNASSTKPVISDDYLAEFLDMVSKNPFMDNEVWMEMLGQPNTRPKIYVDEANELVRRLSFTPNAGKYKAVIMWQAESMVESAANKLLKLIEEPPGDAIIILTTSHPTEILPTIYSRTQRVKIKRFSDDLIAQWMFDNKLCDAESAAAIAPLAQGSITEALRLVSKKDESTKFFDYFVALMRLAYQRDIAKLKDWSISLSSEKRETVVAFFEYLSRMIRENFIANLNQKSLNLMLPAEEAFSVNFARFINERNVSQLLEAINTAIEDVRANVNCKIVLFDFAISVILLLKQ